MTYQNERQMSTRASKFPIEEYYTNMDVNPNMEVDPNVGFTYDFPVRWANDPSLNKAIGVRRLDCIPTCHVFQPAITYYLPNVTTDDDGNEKVTYSYGAYISKKYAVTKNNNLLEILTDMSVNLSTSEYTLNYDYSSDGTLTFTAYSVKAKRNTQFYFGFYVSSIASFLRFLNQEDTTENRKILTDYTVMEKTFTNVWDRENLEFHTSFSTSKRGFIGLKGDFYPNISYIFCEGTDSPQFTLWFTSDGKNRILPRYCHFICQLTFILNYKKSLVT